MMKRHSIRSKMWTVLTILLLLTVILAGVGLYAVYLYKNVVRDIAWRVNVLPVAGKLGGCVSELRSVAGELKGIQKTKRKLFQQEAPDDRIPLEARFQKSLFEVKQAYNDYQTILEDRVADIGVDDSFKQEFSTVGEIRRSIQLLSTAVSQPGWGAMEPVLETVESELLKLWQLTDTLPGYLHDELKGYSQTMKRQARLLNTAAILSLVISAVLLIVLVRLSYIWIFQPLGILIAGSRKVADGTFQYRIQLKSRDEMAELGEAMNQMTERFQAIRDDLDNQVKLRSNELIQSERLASVGFLAAGVAHEINNPLMSISTCAESLQRRLVSTLARSGCGTDDTELAKRYLKMIQDEAFRCKGITEKLLDLTRTEKRQRERTDLVPLVSDIVEITRQHGDYKRKTVRLDLPESLYAMVNAQEIKQVVLNLLTNALSCTDSDGVVDILLRKDGPKAVLSVMDNGSGMDETVLKNVFEPFFTKRQNGTGLGLSITYRIISEHFGRIEAKSDGPGKGSTFLVELPLCSHEKTDR